MTTPVRSMTGFARRAIALPNGMTLVLTLKTVNHRFLDIASRLSAGLEELDIPVRAAVKQAVARGHVDITLSAQRGEDSSGEVNLEAVRAYVDTFRSIAAAVGLAQEPDLAATLRLPGMTGADAASAMSAADVDAVIAGCADALTDLNRMRAEEGSRLVEELRAWLGKILAEVQAAEQVREHIRQALYERLRARLEELTGVAGNDARLLQEAALLADRGDIQEECARMRAHVAQFDQLLASGGECGKKLDFLLQEMNREANTLSSKTTGITGDGLQVTRIGLNLKAAIEKCREQVQNLE